MNCQLNPPRLSPISPGLQGIATGDASSHARVWRPVETTWQKDTQPGYDLQKAIENGPVEIVFPWKMVGFPWLCKRLPEGIDFLLLKILIGIFWRCSKRQALRVNVCHGQSYAITLSP